LDSEMPEKRRFISYRHDKNFSGIGPPPQAAANDCR
jgi:hypothetical protein